MKVLRLREEIKKEKSFLISLTHKNARQTLKKASEDQLDLVLQILYLITSGKIRLSKDSFLRLRKRGKLDSLQTALASKAKMKKLLRGPKVEKLHCLILFSAYYDSLFFLLFHVPGRQPLT